MKAKFITEGFQGDGDERDGMSGFRGDFKGDTPADQGARAARRDNALRPFKINNLDDNGFPINTMGIFMAHDEDEARELAAQHWDNQEIVTTGFYEARETTLEKLDAEREKYEEELKKAIASLKPINESLNEGFATEEGRNLDKIARMLGYDDLHEMLGDNPGLYEASVTWIDDTFLDQFAHEGYNPEELEKVGLYNSAEEARRVQSDEDVDDEEDIEESGITGMHL